MGTTQSVEYAIAGAGVAGLSCAFHLSRAGQHDYMVLERAPEVGGTARSHTVDGFTFDYASHILYTKSPYVARLYDELLGSNRLERRREAWIYSHGTFTRYPFQANLHGLPRDVVYECLVAFLHARDQRYATENLNFAEWAELTFGRGIAKHFMLPYNRKQWKFPLDQMTFAWVGNRVLRPPLDDVVRGALMSQQKGFGPNNTFLYPRHGGIDIIPRGLHQRLGADGANVRCGAPIAQIMPEQRRLILESGEKIGYGRLIYTLPLPALARLVRQPPPELARALERLAYNRHYCLLFGVKGREYRERMRVYLPEDRFLAHRLGFPQAVQPDAAPAGWGSIYAEITEARASERRMSVQQMTERTLADLRAVGVVDAGDAIEPKGCLTLDPAYPIYTLTHADDVALIHGYLEQHGIYPAGRFADWRYFNIDHTILSAKAVVEKLSAGRGLEVAA